MRTLSVLPLALLLAACGAAEDGDPGANSGAARDTSQLYEASALVLDEDGEGPVLCLGGVADSYPPQCGGVLLANWDWEAVDGEERAAGASWGEYRVVGTYDGEVFTVTEVGPSVSHAGSSGDDFMTPCPEPDGGWAVVDANKASEADFDAAAAAAGREPDSVAVWVDYVGDFRPEEMEQMEEEGLPLQILNAAFSGDVERHEAELRDLWGGPLCVSEREGATAEELDAIRAEAEAAVNGDLGLEFLWSSSSEVAGTIEIGVVVDVDGSAQATLDERFGSGVVLLVPGLRPVR